MKVNFDWLEPILKLTENPTLKSPVRIPQHPPSPKVRPDLNHNGFSSNFQDILLIIYWHDLSCQRWSHPPGLQSRASMSSKSQVQGQIQIPFVFFLIIYQHNLWCQRWHQPLNLQSGTINVLQAPLDLKNTYYDTQPNSSTENHTKIQMQPQEYRSTRCTTNLEYREA